MAYSSKDFLSWDDDIDLDGLLGEYTADETENGSSVVKQTTTYACPECNKEYKSISGFRGHAMKKHDKSLKASDHRKGHQTSSTNQSFCTDNELHKLHSIFSKAYRQSLQNLQTEPLYNIFDNTEATIAAACLTSAQTEQYFNDFMTECFKGNKVTSPADRESFFKTVHQKRTDKQLIFKGVSHLQALVNDCDTEDLVNFIQVFVLDLIGEIVKERKNMEIEQSEKKQSKITDADSSILFYISGFIIKALEKKYLKIKNKLDKEKHLSDIETLVNKASEKSFTHKYRVWYEKKNRGGLKKPRDDFFFLIREFERLLRENTNMEKLDSREHILDSYMVQHYSEKLFDTHTCLYVEDALDIFITVRGHAHARAEQRKYKRESAKDFRGKSSSSLRDILKNVTNDRSK